MSEEAVTRLWARLRAALRRRWPGARVSEPLPLPGGASSLTFSAMLDGTVDADGPIAIKMAPPGLKPVRNRDVLRQARAIRAVAGAEGVHVPEVLVTDVGTPPFFVMRFVAGEAYEPCWDVSGDPPAPDVVARRARAAARMLPQLQAIDPALVGLGDEPVISPTQELERWVALYATAGEDLRDGEAPLREALRAHVPEAVGRPAILHGDYRLGNMQFAGDRLAALIDWELWALGDPRHDLAFLLTFCDPGQQRALAADPANRAARAAMPDAETLLNSYLQAAGRDAPPPDLDWFIAVCAYKLGATMAVIAKRNRRAESPDPDLERVAATTPPMLTRALDRLRGQPRPA
ncbi:MAG: phosphotransferase family protein [Solirubrobacteraceae bacterium]